MEFIVDYLQFLARAVTIVAAIVLLLLFIIGLRSDASQTRRGRIEFEDLGEGHERIKEEFEALFVEEDETNKKAKTAVKNGGEGAESTSKSDKKRTKKVWEVWKKAEKKPADTPKKSRLYVIDFDGDMAASAVNQLRHEVSAVLQIANEGDEVLLKLKSPGGMVQSYGLAAAQLARLREKNIHLTASVDEVAASGGYLMACVANRIVAAPFAIVGSIGVVAQMPNFHKLLEKWDIDYEQFTAGEFKRTVTMFGENTDEGRDKFKEELEDVHSAFKSFVSAYRPDLDIDMIATGEHWLASQAKALGLVDELKTSDGYIIEKIDTMKVYGIRYRERRTIRQGISRFVARLSSRFSL